MTPRTAVSVYKVTLLILGITRFSTSQPLINQLAVLFRARPPWPTTFPSGTSSVEGLGMGSGEVPLEEGSLPLSDPFGAGLQRAVELQDFSSFNNLLTGHSLADFTEFVGEDGHGLSPILATSHPLPQLEISDGKGGKSVLLAHPVLGPNPKDPPEKVDHKFNSLPVRHGEESRANSEGLYVSSTTERPFKYSAVRTNSNWERSRGMNRMDSALQNLGKFLFPHNHKKRKVMTLGVGGGGGGVPMQMQIPIRGMGKPPPGGKIIAIPVPVPHGNPFLRPQFMHDGRPSPGILAMRQPFPPMVDITSTTTTPLPSNQIEVTNFGSIFSPSQPDLNFPQRQTNNIINETLPIPPTNATTMVTTTTTTLSTPPSTTTLMTTTTSTTKSPSPSPSPSWYPRKRETPRPYHYDIRNIQDVLHSSENGNLEPSPSTVIGTFRYPDPPTKPRLINMNRLHQEELVKSGEWIPQNPTPTHQVIPITSEKKGSSNRKSKSVWKYEPSTAETTAASRIYSIRSPKLKNFKPSLQVHSFEDTTSGLREFITLNPTSAPLRDSVSSATSTTRSAEDLPAMESGFRPFNHYAFMHGMGGSISSTTERNTLARLRNEMARDIITSNVWNSMSNRQDRKLYSPLSTAFTVGGGYSYTHNPHPLPFTTDTTTTTQRSKEDQKASGSSRERLEEDWLIPRQKVKKDSSKGTESLKGKRPSDCDKFHRFGFCPVTELYPLDKAEDVSGRCKTLLTHLVAPLPKADVRYDVVVSKSQSQRKWSWKNFAGKPVCETKEVKVIPGWAKNEEGDWLVILQTPDWKQEAQITLCATPTETVEKGTKCVQRFTAQRLVVLDPDDEDRCPVVRSVFLPSACVCLNDEGRKERTKPDKKESHPPSNSFSGRSLLTSIFGMDLPSSPEAEGNEENESRENWEKRSAHHPHNPTKSNNSKNSNIGFTNESNYKSSNSSVLNPPSSNG